MGKHSKHAPHSCYHCSSTINSDEPETQVEGIPYPKRYAHATEQGCAKALERMGFNLRYDTGDPEDEAENYYNG